MAADNTNGVEMVDDHGVRADGTTRYIRMMHRRGDALYAARFQADLCKAFCDYEARLSSAPLGQQIRLGETALSMQLVATSDIDMGRPITAFAGDVLFASDRQKDMYGKCGEDVSTGVKWCYFSGGGKPLLAASRTEHHPEYLKYVYGVAAVNIVGFAPAWRAATHIEALVHTPDRGGIWVQDVVAAANNPYDALKQTPDAVPTFAQVTINYLQKVSARANVRVVAAEGRPTVLVAVRAIKEGETLRTGRPPAYWIANPDYTQAVFEHIKANPGPEIDPDTLRTMVFGDAEA